MSRFSKLFQFVHEQTYIRPLAKERTRRKLWKILANCSPYLFLLFLSENSACYWIHVTESQNVGETDACCFQNQPFTMPSCGSPHWHGAAKHGSPGSHLLNIVEPWDAGSLSPRIIAWKELPAILTTYLDLSRLCKIHSIVLNYWEFAFKELWYLPLPYLIQVCFHCVK